MLTWEQLRDEVPLPCIVHWRQRHFVVVYAIKKHRKFSSLTGIGKRGKLEITKSNSTDENITVFVGDPASGLIKYSKKELLSTTKSGEREGMALLLESTPDFYRQEDERMGKLKFMYLLGYLRPCRRYIAKLFLNCNDLKSSRLVLIDWLTLCTPQLIKFLFIIIYWGAICKCHYFKRQT
jgi:ATP-binding cassette, subfamily B, bacterial